MSSNNSSSPLAISVRGLSKHYSIARNLVKHSTLIEAAAARLKSGLKRPERDEFWALRDVDFDIAPGEVVGVIGRNGAGKSTLLKVMSQITEPTTGQIALWGRIGSLLEVGTGFHPELTGRENIYLNGSILGMSRREIAASFDQIVDFSGVEKFLETPVKRFSSGMYVRLAFAVAAHLSTEILVVDEVLSVGDAEFQSKCMGKMKDVATNGRTVLFVSHQMQSVQALCTRAIFLQKGQVTYDGEVSGAIGRYMESFASSGGSLTNLTHRRGSGQLRVTELWMDKEMYGCAETKTVRFVVERQTEDAPPSFFVSVLITDSMGTNIMQGDSRMANRYFETRDRCELYLSFSHPWLKPGRYIVSLYVCSAGILDYVEGAYAFEVMPILPYNAPANSEAMRNAITLPDFACGEVGESMVFSSETLDSEIAIS